MSAQLAIDQRAAYRGLRPLDPRKDLNQVADLIEEAFTGELEPGGIAALRDMRMLSHVGPLVSLMARSDPYLEDVLGGFVWVEDDRVVGNVTIQRLDAYGSRWQIANVAVTKDYQSRGIGRALVTAALERIAERRGSWAVLQVRSDNATAKGLYQRLGFEDLTEDVWLQIDRLPPAAAPQAEAPAGLRPYRHDEWQARYTLESAWRSEKAQWWRPVRSHDFMQLAASRLGERVWEWAAATGYGAGWYRPSMGWRPGCRSTPGAGRACIGWLLPSIPVAAGNWSSRWFSTPCRSCPSIRAGQCASSIKASTAS